MEIFLAVMLVFLEILIVATMIVIGWGLVEVAIEMLRKRPEKGIVFGTTIVSDAIARAMKNGVESRPVT